MQESLLSIGRPQARTVQRDEAGGRARGGDERQERPEAAVAATGQVGAFGVAAGRLLLDAALPALVAVAPLAEHVEAARGVVAHLQPEAISCDFTSHDITSHDITSHDITLRCSTLHYIVLCYISTLSV